METPKAQYRMLNQHEDFKELSWDNRLTLTGISDQQEEVKRLEERLGHARDLLRYRIEDARKAKISSDWINMARQIGRHNAKQ